LHLHFLIAANWFLDPIVAGLWNVVKTIDVPIKNYGWSLIILAALIRLVFWPLNTAQFKSMMKMQKVAPQIKAMQARYKGDQAKLQQETMALYKREQVNPFAGCWPMLVQYPIIISVFYVVTQNKSVFENENWMWIGTAISAKWPAIFASSLAHPDLVLIILYAASMYFSVRFGSIPSTDPQQAQMQRMMSIISPLMLGWLGYKYQWPSAMVLYWFAYNLFTMGQTIYLLRRYHEPLSFVDSGHVITEDVPPEVTAKPQKALSSNGSPKSGSGRKKKNKKGA